MKSITMFVLAAVLAPQAGFASAAPQKCSTCESCKCPEGFCPKRCAVDDVRLVASKPKGDLDAANAAVAKGERVVLCLGVPAIDGAYSTGPIKGYTNGVYDCYRRPDGKHEMQIRSAAVIGAYCVNGTCYSPGIVQGGIVQPTYGNPFGSCPNGQCPKQGVRYR